MSRFTEQAASILATAEAAAWRGEQCADLTILIGQDGGIHMLSDTDWPLDSLTSHHGAKAGYRVIQRNGEVRVEGREGTRTCLLVGQAFTPAAVRSLLKPQAKLEPSAALLCGSLSPRPTCYE